MKRFLIVAVSAAVLAGCGAGRTAQWETSKPAGNAAATAESPDALISAGDTAWASRGDKTQLEAAIASWEKATAMKADDYKTLAKLSRAYFFLADGHLRKGGETSEPYLTTFEKGTAAGERALAAVSPKFKQEVTGGIAVEEAVKTIPAEGIDALYWYASNLGKWAKAKGFATMVGNKDKIRASMSRVKELDENYFHAAPYRYFGAFYALAPGFAGGDLNKSKESFEEAVKRAPMYAGTKVLYAETYAAKKKDWTLYNKLLDEVMAMPDDAIPGLEAETRNEKEKARELKDKAKQS